MGRRALGTPVAAVLGRRDAATVGPPRAANRRGAARHFRRPVPPARMVTAGGQPAPPSAHGRPGGDARGEGSAAIAGDGGSGGGGSVAIAASRQACGDPWPGAAPEEIKGMAGAPPPPPPPPPRYAPMPAAGPPGGRGDEAGPDGAGCVRIGLGMRLRSAGRPGFGLSPPWLWPPAPAPCPRWLR